MFWSFYFIYTWYFIIINKYLRLFYFYSFHLAQTAYNML